MKCHLLSERFLGVSSLQGTVIKFSFFSLSASHHLDGLSDTANQRAVVMAWLRVIRGLFCPLRVPPGSSVPRNNTLTLHCIVTEYRLHNYMVMNTYVYLLSNCIISICIQNNTYSRTHVLLTEFTGIDQIRQKDLILWNGKQQKYMIKPINVHN